MLNPADVPLTIDDDEELGRRMYSSKDRKLPINLFMPPKGELNVSTDRLFLASTHDDMSELTHLARHQCPKHKKNFYGWARLSIPAVKQEERMVEAAHNEENPYHAHIVLPETAADNEVAMTKHAQQLSDEAVRRGFWAPVDRE